MARAIRFLGHYVLARLRRRCFELSPVLYRKFQLAAALPRWRAFPFYRHVTGPLQNFPLLNKEQLLRNFQALNVFGATYESCLEEGLEKEKSRNFLKEKSRAYSVGLSSGTSGKRGVFLTTDSERIRWAATILAHCDFLQLFAPERIAFFLRANSPLYESVGGRRLRFRFFDLARPFPELAKELKTFAPTVLIAPPAALELLRLEENTARLCQPRVVVSVADKLELHERKSLEAHFGLRLQEVYQATEGFLGISCQLGRLHLNEELFYLERHWVDEAHTAFEPVVSDYFRASQAFVRMRLDDVLVPLAAPCPCGSKRQPLAEIRGRADDVLLFPASSGALTPVLPDFIRQALQNGLSASTDFKVRQSASGALELQLPQDPGAAERGAVEAELRSGLAALGIEPPSVSWSFGLRRGPGEKRKRVERS